MTMFFLLSCVATVAALVPAAYGLVVNPSFSLQRPVVPCLVRSTPDHTAWVSVPDVHSSGPCPRAAWRP